MTRMNHERPILKLIDNAKRLRRSLTTDDPAAVLEPAPRDRDTPPALPVDQARLMKKVAQNVIHVAQGRSALEQIERARKQGTIAAEKHHARVQLGQEAEVRLTELLAQLLISTIGQIDEETGNIDEWVDWWLTRMTREGRNTPRLRDILREASDQATQVLQDRFKAISDRHTGT